MSNVHEFVLYNRPECAANPDEHCQFVWFGAPKNHPIHTCYEPNRRYGLDGYIGDEDHPLTTWPTYGGIQRSDKEYLRHILLMRDGETALCDGLGFFMWCIEDGKR